MTEYKDNAVMGEESLSGAGAGRIDRSIVTARCTLVQSAVLPSHVVCPSVCDVGGL